MRLRNCCGAILFATIYMISMPLMGTRLSHVPDDRVMTVNEFKQAINNNYFLKQINKTINDESFGIYEIEMIEFARNNQNIKFGGSFAPGRDIGSFTGDTLIVGGGKKPGIYGGNQGKTVLIDNAAHEKETRRLVDNLTSGKWTSDPYSGKDFKTKAERFFYIKEIKAKQSLYKQAYSEWNKDILNRYYTLNIEKDVEPDILASIVSEDDTNNIPNKKFMYVEFEDVPCEVFLNPKLYKILARITKSSGNIKLSISNCCRRLIVPIIQETKFGEQFIEEIEKKFHILEGMHPTYHRIDITVINK